jgi:anti-sigma factor RsiW
MTRKDEMTELREIESLLPWHAAGTLSGAEAARVEAALARHPELARQLALVREEMAETIHLNETAGAPSAQAMERLFAAIEAEPARRRRPERGGFARRLLAVFASLTPRQLAFSAGAAAVVLLLQAGIIAAMLTGQRQVATQVAAPAAGEDPGRFALVRFTPEASARDIAAVLEANRVSIVDGPRPGGLYRVRIAEMEGSGTLTRGAGAPSPAEEREQVLARLRAASGVISLAVPAP